MLLGKVVGTFGQGQGLISGRRPCPPEGALSSVDAILSGQGLYDKNRPCPKQLQTLPDMPDMPAKPDMRRLLPGRAIWHGSGNLSRVDTGLAHVRF